MRVVCLRTLFCVVGGSVFDCQVGPFALSKTVRRTSCIRTRHVSLLALVVQHQLIVKDPEQCIDETKGVLAHVNQFSHLCISVSSGSGTSQTFLRRQAGADPRERIPRRSVVPLWQRQQILWLPLSR